jgi:hypothetical protein
VALAGTRDRERPRVIVIGGGPRVRPPGADQAGAQVTLLESGPLLGGLASSFDVQGVRIERYYHFICKGTTGCWRRSRAASSTAC